MAKNHKGAVGTYTLIVLILGVITYAEFAIVEYPQAWLGQTMTFVVLAVLSVLKFILVVMFFMHLKGDDRMYSGFFTSGMVIALATFIAMTAMFILPRAMSYNEARDRAEALEGAAVHGEAHVPADVEELITTDGRSRPASERADVPAPADRATQIEAPLASNDASTYEVAGAEGPVDTAAGTDEEPAGEGEVAGAEPAEADETAADDAGEAAAEEPVAAAEWDRDMGTQVYNANCVGCHQAAGQGIPGAFPPLAGHAADVYAAGGDEYLPQVLLFGLTGQIQVEGMTYNGFMPAWAQLSDDQIANVLNHVIADLGDAPDGFVPYAAADIAGHRGDGLAAGDVHGIRAELGLD